MGEAVKRKGSPLSGFTTGERDMALHGACTWGPVPDEAYRDDGTGPGADPPPSMFGRSLPSLCGPEYLEAAEREGVELCQCRRNILADGRSACDFCVVEQVDAGSFVPKSPQDEACALVHCMSNELRSRGLRVESLAVEMGERRTYISHYLHWYGSSGCANLPHLERVCDYIGYVPPWRG